LRKLFAFGLAILMIFGLTIGVMAGGHEQDIVDTAIGAPDFDTLVAAVVAAGLVDTLKSPGPFTVFAPTDAAFAALPDGVLDKLLANPDILAKVLLYHVVPGEVLASTVVTLDGQEVATAQGQKVSISVNNGDVKVNDANVVATDVLCTNGVIHVIDKVLVPEWDIVDAAILNDDFNTLVAALVAADLVSALQGAGPFTVFAPTDDAFAALLAALDITAGELLASDDLANILLYHVVSGEYKAGILFDGMVLEALNGGKLLISISSVMVNDANVIAADVETTNGVIHVIDAVLIPAEDVGDGDVDLPQTGGYPYYFLGLLALAGGALSFKKRK